MKRLYKLKHQARQIIQKIKTLSPVRTAILISAFVILIGGGAAFALQQAGDTKPAGGQLSVASKATNSTPGASDGASAEPSPEATVQDAATTSPGSGGSTSKTTTNKPTTLVLGATVATAVRGQSTTLSVSAADGRPIEMPQLQGGNRNILLNAPGGPAKSVWTVQLRAWETAPLGKYALTISAQDKSKQFISAGLTLTVVAPPVPRFTIGHLIAHVSEPGTQAQYFSLLVEGSSNFSGPITVSLSSSNPGVICSMVTYGTSVGEYYIQCSSSSASGAQGTLNVTVTGGGESRSKSTPFSIAASNDGV